MLPAWMIDSIDKRKRDEVAQDNHIGSHIGDEYINYTPPKDDDEEEEVLNCGSGSAPAPPPPPDPMAEAKAQMELEAERERIAEGNRRRDELKAEAKLQSDKAAFNSRLQGAWTGAQRYGAERFNKLGIQDDYGLMSSYLSAIDQAKSSVPDLDPNPAGYINSASAWETALGEARGSARKKMTGRYESEVPEGFETTYIPDTADDELINRIINEQFGETSEGLERARARGQLNETGYNTALRSLGQQKSSAIAKANELGLGVLETGRQSLRDIDKKARAGLTNWDFGDTFDPTDYASKIKTGASTFTGGLEGKLRSSFGDTEFFDPAALIAKAGKTQGAINPGSTALKDAITEEERRRTANSVGAF